MARPRSWVGCRGSSRKPMVWGIRSARGEMADAPDLGSGPERGGSSSLPARTKFVFQPRLIEAVRGLSNYERRRKVPDLQCKGSVFTPDAHAHAYFAWSGRQARGRTVAPNRPSAVRSNQGEKKGAPRREAPATQRRWPATQTLSKVHFPSVAPPFESRASWTRFSNSSMAGTCRREGGRAAIALSADW